MSGDDTSRARPSVVPALPMLLAALLIFVQGRWADSIESQTWDEAYAVAIGDAQVRDGRFGILPENPPLLGLLVSPALRAVGARPPIVPDEAWKDVTAPQYGLVYFYQIGNDAPRMLTAARTAVLALTAIAAAVLVFWAFCLYGAAGAWIAASLAAFEPNWLAHGHLAAWDGICAATLTLACFALAMFLRRPSLTRAACAGVLVGLAWSAKHTALVLWPMMLLLAIWTSPLAGRWRLAADGTLRGRGLALAWSLIPAIGFAVVGASYNLQFRYDIYFDGISQIYGLTREGHLNYLLGSFQAESFPHYYLVALAAKLPLGFLPLVVFGIGLAFVVLRRDRTRGAMLAPALLLMGAIAGTTAMNPHNIGIRHVLPAIPMFILLAAGCWGAAESGLRWRRIGVVLLCLLGAAETLGRAPRYLSFFNVAAGGPSRGYEILDDSNIDWGQGLIDLAELQQREGLGVLRLDYFGSAHPPAYGVQATPMQAEEFTQPQPGRIYARSVHQLLRARQEYGAAADWLARYEPFARAGDAILLFRF